VPDIQPPQGMTYDKAVDQLGRYIIVHQEVIRTKQLKARRLMDRIERTLSRESHPSYLRELKTLYNELRELSGDNYGL
jgi:hypothetical protein